MIQTLHRTLNTWKITVSFYEAVSIVNPAQVKDFGRSLGVRTKTDGVDSFVLARFGALLNPKPWIPPSKEARTLQALLSRREAISQDLQRERNRLEKADATETPQLILKSIVDSVAFMENQLTKFQQDIDDHINKHPQLKVDRELMISIPAVGPQLSNHLLAVMHNHQFQSAEQLAAYLGLVPWSVNPALPSRAVLVYPKQARPTFAPYSIWRL